MTDGIIFSYAAHFSSGIFPLEIFGHTESNHPVLICISITSLTAPMHSRAQDGVPPRCCAINMCCNLTSTLPPWKETLECQAFVKWKGDEDIARHFPPTPKQNRFTPHWSYIMASQNPSLVLDQTVCSRQTIGSCDLQMSAGNQTVKFVES